MTDSDARPAHTRATPFTHAPETTVDTGPRCALPAEASGPLEIEVHREGDSTTLRLRGELDLATAEQLQRSIRKAVSRHDPHRLVLDLTDLSFVDSSGLGVIVRAHQRLARRGRQLRLLNPGRQVDRVLQITGLHTRLHITHPAGR